MNIDNITYEELDNAIDNGLKFSYEPYNHKFIMLKIHYLNRTFHQCNVDLKKSKYALMYSNVSRSRMHIVKYILEQYEMLDLMPKYFQSYIKKIKLKS